MMSEAAPLPKLRFPEFRDSEGWKEKKLRNLGKLVAGLTYQPSDVQSEGLLVLRSSNIQNGVIDLEDKVFVSPDVKGANLSQPNDILICVRNGSKPLIGKNALVPEALPLCTHGAFMTVFRSTEPNFTFQLFQTDTYRNQVVADLGATINSINGGNLLNYRFYVPEPPEQQKIADCLTSIDDLITAEAEKLAALKDHKKGLMQQLFPREGETKPRLRFPEFRDAGDWEEKRLSTMINLFSGSHLASGMYGVTGEIPYFTGPSDFTDSIESATKWAGKSANAAQKDDTLITVKGSGVGQIWSLVLPSVAMGRQLMAVRAVSAYPRFIYQFLLTQRSRFVDLASGNLIPGLARGDILGIIDRFPTFNEQKRIGDCLASVDELIKYEENRIEALKDHKKGLMQQLFPASNEVNG